MNAKELETRVLEGFPRAMVRASDLTGSGNHFELIVICDDFEGKTRVKRHQMLMERFAAELKTEALHALTIQALTTKEAKDYDTRRST